MERVPAYEAVDEGSTPPGRTIIRCMQQFFYVWYEFYFTDASWYLNTGEWWNGKHNGPHKDFENCLHSEKVSKTVELVSCKFKSYLPCQ